MGWFKSIIRALDPLRPEWEKKLTGKIEKSVGIKPGSFLSTLEKPEDSGGGAPAPAPTLDASSLSDDQLTAEAQKRLAKLGKYFTSPLGVLSGASTGAQRTFS